MSNQKKRGISLTMSEIEDKKEVYIFSPRVNPCVFPLCVSRTRYDTPHTTPVFPYLTSFPTLSTVRTPITGASFEAEEQSTKEERCERAAEFARETTVYC